MSGWNGYQMERLRYEAGVLAENHQHLDFEVEWSGAAARFWYWKNERWFRVRLEIPTTYPDEKPSLYIEQPRPLYDAFGNDINDHAPSHNWHLLYPSDAGEAQICHFPSSVWDETKSLHLVVLKAKLWLDAYCWHLSSYQAICDFFRDCE